MDNRRKHERIPGPFDGRRIDALVTPVTLYNLSEGGCFVNAMHEQEEGVVFRLEIDLPYVGTVAVTATTLRGHANAGFAVRFTDMNLEDTIRLQEALDEIKRRTQ